MEDAEHRAGGDLADRLKREAIRQGDGYSQKVELEYDTLWNSPSWDHAREHRARWMLKSARKYGPRKLAWNVLEIGCGIGWTTLEVAKQAPWITRLDAVDTATRALQEAERLAQETPEQIRQRVHFRYGNFFDWEGGPYDLIFMHEVFEHVPDPVAIFEKAAQLVAPGGVFMISTPNGNRLQNRFRKFFGKPPTLVDPYHIKEYDIDELQSAAAGWQCVDVSGRTLFDAEILSILLAFGFKNLIGKTAKLAHALSDSKLNYWLGSVAPRLSREWLVTFRRLS